MKEDYGEEITRDSLEKVYVITVTVNRITNDVDLLNLQIGCESPPPYIFTTACKLALTLKSTKP